MTSCNPTLHITAKLRCILSPTDPPDGHPSCSVEPALNHTSLRLLCSWSGGYPAPSLHWTGNLKQVAHDEANTGQQTKPLTTAILLSSESLTSNDNSFTCMGSHVALKQSTECSTRACKKQRVKQNSPFSFHFSHISLKTSSAPPDVPPAEPECFAYVTTSKQYLMLSCSWDGGAPKALVWWEGPGGQGKGGEENSNILILRYGTARGGNPYICHAKHPLLVQTKTCRLTLGQYTLSDPP